MKSIFWVFMWSLFAIHHAYGFEELPKRLNLSLTAEHGRWCGPWSAPKTSIRLHEPHPHGDPFLHNSSSSFQCVTRNYQGSHEAGTLTGDATLYVRLPQRTTQAGLRMVGLGFEFASPQGITRFRLRGNGIHVVFRTTF